MYKLLSQGYLISGIYKHTSDPRILPILIDLNIIIILMLDSLPRRSYTPRILNNFINITLQFRELLPNLLRQRISESLPHQHPKTRDGEPGQHQSCH
jgi:hypothetical protein